jgi:hypothetical protein
MRFTRSLHVALLIFSATLVACESEHVPTGAQGGAVGSGTGGSAGIGGAGAGGTGGVRTDASADAPEVGTPDASLEDDASERDDASEEPTGSEPSDEAATDDAQEEADDALLADADTGPPPPTLCVERCTTNSECQTPNLPQKFCNLANNHCVNCLHDVRCVAQSSFWIVRTCTADGDCSTDQLSFGDFCVDVEGTGYCAFDSAHTTQCIGLTGTYTIKKFGSDEMVTVCANTAQTCDPLRGACIAPCSSSLSCNPARGGRICNTTTRHCECATDTDCGAGLTRCNQLTKQCECPSTDTCVATDSGRTLVCE